MKKTNRHFIMLLMFSMMLTAHVYGRTSVAVNTDIVINVANSDEVINQLEQRSNSLKGYFTFKGNERITLKIPHSSEHEFHSYIKSNWKIIQQKYSTNDLAVRLLKTNSSLKSKQELLKQYLDLLTEASSKKIVLVEKEVTTLVQEIEILKGQARYMQHQLKFVNFSVRFQLNSDKIRILNQPSSFQWINDIGLPNLMADF